MTDPNDPPACPWCGMEFEYQCALSDDGAEVIAAYPDCPNPDCEVNQEEQ